jgi:hypothetical protein
MNGTSACGDLDPITGRGRRYQRQAAALAAPADSDPLGVDAGELARGDLVPGGGDTTP